MEKYTNFIGQVVPLNRSDVDVEQILPSRFLNRIEKTGWGQFAFYNWRYLKDGQTLNPDFELNKPEFQDASILLTCNNFGLGVRREQALWALAQCGIKTIISTGFSKTFYRHSIYNGVLPVTVLKEKCEQMLNNIKVHVPYNLTVNLENQILSDDFGLTISFEIDSLSKNCLLKGLDLVCVGLANEKEIEAFEDREGK